MGLFSKKPKSDAPPSLKPAKKGSDKEDKKGGVTPFPWSKSDTPVPSASVPAASAVQDPSVVAEGAPSVPAVSGGSSEKLGSLPLRARGFSAPSTVVERIKRLKTKDLAFIAAGLAVLIMAPLAEYLMTGPETKPHGMQGGFAERGPLFSESASPYEDGISGISPGGLIGQDSDVITPLNVRDPSHLILGPGGSEKPAAPPSASAAGGKTDTGWNEAISAAKAGADRAVRRTPGLPRPSAKMPGALRGLSALSGGSSGGGPTFRLEPPASSRNFFGAPRSSNALSRVQSVPGFRGGGFRSIDAGNGSPGSHLPSPSGGGGSTQTTAASAPNGNNATGTSGGRASPGAETKNPGGNSTKDNKNTSMGENLALLRAKMEMEKAIGLKWDKRHYFELDRRKMMDQIGFQTAAQTAQQVIVALVQGLLQPKQQGGGGGGTGGGGTGGGGAPMGGPQTPQGARGRTPKTSAPTPTVPMAEGSNSGQADAVENDTAWNAHQSASEALKNINQANTDIEKAKKKIDELILNAEKIPGIKADELKPMQKAVKEVTQLDQINTDNLQSNLTQAEKKIKEMQDLVQKSDAKTPPEAFNADAAKAAASDLGNKLEDFQKKVAEARTAVSGLTTGGNVDANVTDLVTNLEKMEIGLKEIKNHVDTYSASMQSVQDHTQGFNTQASTILNSLDTPAQKKEKLEDQSSQHLGKLRSSSGAVTQ